MIKLILTEKAKKENKKVLDPKTLKRIPKDGVFVQKVDSYWTNRIKDGDVMIQEKKASKK